MMSSDKLVTELFSAIDDKNTETFCSFLHQNCSFRFGNMPEVNGVNEVGEFVSQFFDSIKAISHNISEHWSVPDGIICHGFVTYTRHDNTTLTVPFCNVLKQSEAKITDYLIFADTSLLYTSD